MTEKEDSDVICWEGSAPIVGTINLEELINLIEGEIFKEGEKFVYESPDPSQCVNAFINPIDDRWHPSCLIGRVLWRSEKVDPNLIVANRFSSADAGVIRQIWADGKTASFARLVQQYQDDGLQWGYALLKAKEDLRNGEL
jgi:hypothetical protein